MTHDDKKKVTQLRRRADHLGERIENYRGRSDSYDRAERVAIEWALRIIESAEARGLLDELAAAPLAAAAAGRVVTRRRHEDDLA